MMDTIIAIGITTQITALFLWLGMRFTGVNGTYLGMQIVSFSHFILALIPFIGPILATIVAYILLDKFTDADFWGIIFMVVAAWALKFFSSCTNYYRIDLHSLESNPFLNPHPH